ncbi:LuxR family transcriptional regulator [Fervidicella metallireducens AeB]|uniref:Stage 0 sporulation protein A homolog n=1 Tax=Fervidicella metallireducens AeB TaxID=1403537 RepID=A0A017RUK4_9CLOT|nr:response regulator transcription factor [Fervidicella metallireducens]EYE88079.1 LuxR family transcriptional regulator [Fervidicella metallireducens AeB]
MKIRILIADDDSLIRESLKIILGMDEDFDVVGCVENGLKAVEYCLRERIDVALLDVRMPVLNGVKAVKEISSKTNTKTLILTTFDDDEYIMEAVKNGAKGYLLKNNSPDKIKDAIKLVFSGNTVMQDIVMDKIKEGLERKTEIDKSIFTYREIEIMEQISKGLSNKEIAKKLFISEGTVKNYITSILDKTNLQHRTQIAIYYLQGGTMIGDR